MKTAIYGAGSLGIILGAYLTEAGEDVTLVNRNVIQVSALQKQGATVTGKAEKRVPVKAVTPEMMKGVYDAIFLMTKQTDNETSARYLEPFLGESGVLVTMQNGMPELLLEELLGKNRVIGCAVGWGATLTGPGVSELTSEPDELNFDLGCLAGGTDEKLEEVRRVLEKMGNARIRENFIGMRWSKLLINAAFSGMSTVLGCTFGEVAQDGVGVRCAQAVIKECIDTAHAGGVQFEPVEGKDIAKLFDYKGIFKKFLSRRLIPIAIRAHRGIKASMLQDIEKGKPCEIDAINGVVCVAARREGIRTPICDKIVETVHRIEAGEITPSMENRELFRPLIG